MNCVFKPRAGPESSDRSLLGINMLLLGRKLKRIVATLLLAGCAIETARAQEKPDAPKPKPDETGQQEQKTSVAKEVFKNKPVEILLGFKPNLAPLEIPDNAP